MLRLDMGLLFLPATVVGSQEWLELEDRENHIGPDALLSEIIDKRLWTNAEIAWVLRRLVYYYGKKDALLQKAPTERIFSSMVDVLRAFFLLFDAIDPDIDENIRNYISSKLSDATWGVNDRTRRYLNKL